jgi:hypothetical protein
MKAFAAEAQTVNNGETRDSCVAICTAATCK